MPSAWRVRAMFERLSAEGFTAEVQERDLYSLLDVERHAVLDAMVIHQAELPMVVVDGTVACFGSLDLDAVVRVAREVLGRDSAPCC